MAPPAGTGSATAIETLARVYNRLLVDMVHNVRSEHPDLQRTLTRQRHLIIDPVTPSYLANAADTLDARAFTQGDATIEGCMQALRSPEAQRLQLLPRVTVAAVLEGAPAACLPTMRSYIFTFATVAAVRAALAEPTPKNPGADEDLAATGGAEGGGGDDGYGSGDACDADCGGEGMALVQQVLSVLAFAQQGNVSTGAGADALECILHEDIVALLRRVAVASRGAEEPGASPDADPSAALFQSLENSRIGSLAKEITQELDLKDMPLAQLGENPMEALNFANLTDKSSPLGNLVSKVGAKIQSKLASGELRQDELLGDALSLLRNMNLSGGAGSGGGGSQLLNTLLGAAGGSFARGTGAGPASAEARRAAMRDRLRAKRDRDAAGKP